MSWLTVEDAASRLGVSARTVWRMINKNKFMTQQEPASRLPAGQAGTGRDGKVFIWLEAVETEELQPGEIKLPILAASKLTDEILKKTEVMLQAVTATEDISAIEEQLEFESGMPVRTIQRYKADLRKLFRLPARTALHHLADHPQLRPAIEYLLARRSRQDTGDLRSARDMLVVKLTGEYLSLQDFLLALFAWENHNSVSCVRSLKENCRAGRLVYESTGQPVPMDKLPSDRSVSRWLARQVQQDLAVKRARMTKAQWEAKDQIYVTRNPEEYRVGGKLIGDHTELDTLVYRNDGKVRPLWLTAWIDFRSGLLKGYHLAYKPNSDTIAISFKQAVTGRQLRVKVGDEFKPANIVDAPDEADVDNGKDYRSNYTGQVFGKIDFNDDARKTIQRVTKLRYVTKHHPQSKAQQERWFRTIQEITKYLPGYKGAKYQDKPDELKGQLERGELLTEDQFRALVEKAIDAYNNRARANLENMSPMEYALTNQSHQRHVDERVMDFLMMRVQNRIIARGYIRHLGEQFFSLDLRHHNGKKAALYYDPNDIGTIAVYVAGEFAAVAINAKLYGQNEREWLKVIRERAQFDKAIQTRIKGIRQDLTSDEAKAMLFAGEIGNTRSVAPELLQKKIPSVVIMTGIEGEAEKVQQRMEQQRQVADAENKRKQIAKASPIKLINVEKMK